MITGLPGEILSFIKSWTAMIFILQKYQQPSLTLTVTHTTTTNSY
jgi:hypothetical protein